MPPRTPAPPSAPYHPCATCGQQVLTGTTAQGQLVDVEPDQLTYTVLWPEGRPAPLLSLTRGYPLHRCPTPQQHTEEP
jgi:hypothetical protein